MKFERANPPLNLQKRFASALRMQAFTLVELLIVIGIIALLIGILLPALSKAREASKRAACAAKLHSIMIAANIFQVDHKGYYPLAGYLSGTNGFFDPPNLNDTYTSHYAYMAFGSSSTSLTNIIAPITFALGTEMGYPKNMAAWSTADQITGDSDQLGVIRHFLCPSQATDVGQLQQYSWLYAGQLPSVGGEGYGEALSYIFNEAVLGYDDTVGVNGSGRLRGFAARIRQPSKTMFAADGLAGATNSRPNGAWKGINFGPNVPAGPYSNLTVFNTQGFPPVTLSDALTHKSSPINGKPIAGDAQNFDQIRHQGKMNIAFCDGHVELRAIPKFTLASRTAIAVLTNDPQALSLSDVFLLAP